MSKPKRKLKKKQPPQWLYPSLFGVLIVLLALMIWPKYAQHDEEQAVEAKQPIYEDIQVVLPQVDMQKQPQAVIEKSKDMKIYQYGAVKKHGIALVIDDVGYNLDALQRILALGIPVAISIIPESPHAKEAAEMAHAAGQVVMLHMPMEPANPHYRERMDASFLRGDMPKATVLAMLQHGLEKVPYVQGVNNHMGSFLTSMSEPMAWVMQFCQKHQLFFVDSKTSAKSVASDVAANYGLVWGSRRVFLDNSVKEVDIKQSWLSAEHCAQRQGGCIVIGHPHPETVKFLEHQMAHVRPEMMRVVVDLLHVPQG